MGGAAAGTFGAETRKQAKSSVEAKAASANVPPPPHISCRERDLRRPCGVSGMRQKYEQELPKQSRGEPGKYFRRKTRHRPGERGTLARKKNKDYKFLPEKTVRSLKDCESPEEWELRGIPIAPCGPLDTREQDVAKGGEVKEAAVLRAPKAVELSTWGDALGWGDIPPPPGVGAGRRGGGAGEDAKRKDEGTGSEEQSCPLHPRR